MMGNWQTSRIGTGNNFTSRVNTENSVVRTEAMTLRVWRARIESVVFGKDDARQVTAMFSTEQETKALAAELAAFARSQSILVAPFSGEDERRIAALGAGERAMQAATGAPRRTRRRRSQRQLYTAAALASARRRQRRRRRQPGRRFCRQCGVEAPAGRALLRRLRGAARRLRPQPPRRAPRRRQLDRLEQRALQLGERERLGQDDVHAGVAAGRHVVGLGAAGHRHERQRRRGAAAALAPGAGGAQAVEPGHLHVHQHRVDRRCWPRARPAPRARSRRRPAGPAAPRAWRRRPPGWPDRPRRRPPVRPASGGGPGGALAPAGSASAAARCSRAGGRSRGSKPTGNSAHGERHHQREGAAPADRAGRLDAPAHQLRQVVGDRQAQAGAAEAAADALVGLVEGLEQEREPCRVDADAGVGDLDPHPHAAIAPVPRRAAPRRRGRGGCGRRRWA